MAQTEKILGMPVSRTPFSEARNSLALHVEDRRFGGTPLGWALHGWLDPSPDANRDGFYEVVARLIRAGATFNPDTPNAKKALANRKMRAALHGDLPR